MGSSGLDFLNRLGIRIDANFSTTCLVANGQSVQSVGKCTLPMRVAEHTKLIDVFVMPEVPHALILGIDFWRIMGIVPDVRSDSWEFAKDPVACLSVSNAVCEAGELSNNEKAQLEELVRKNYELMGDKLGCTNLVEHVIKTKAEPIKQRYYPVSPVVQAHLNKHLDEMIENGVVRKSNSPWASPVILIKKKSGEHRFCVDYRKLNAVTEKDSYPLPYVTNTLDQLKDARYLSSLDVKSAFFQVPLAEESKKYSAFVVPNRGLWEFNRLPFGLSTSPATWQRLMDLVLGYDLLPHVFCYLDDIVIVTKTFEKHLEVLQEVFRRLREANITVKKEKCQYCRPQLKYLGYVVDKHGLHVDPEKVSAMLDMPAPKKVSGVRGIIGTFSWYRRFIPDFSTLIAPITALLRKSNSKFEWSESCEQAFRILKEKLVTAPILSCPDYNLPFEVQTDASGWGISAVLCQSHPDGEKVVSYVSRSLTRQEQKYSTTERECLAVLFGLEKFRQYIEGVPNVKVVTDHYSLVWLQNLRDVNGRLGRWALKMQQYDVQIVHRKGKEHVVPDTLSRSVPVLASIEVDEEPCPDDRWYSGMKEKIKSKPLRYPQWRVEGDIIYKYLPPRFVGLSNAWQCWKPVVKKAKRQALLEKAHSDPTSGHTGVYKTYARLAENYFWPRMREDVVRLVRRCRVCLQYKAQNRAPVGQMLSHTPPSQPWETISSDLMGPLPKSKSGNRFMLVVTDYFSKYVLVFPMRNSLATNVVKRLENEVFLVYGAPKVAISDNGPQYISREYKNLLDRYDVEAKYTPYFHAQSNPTERMNRTIKRMIASYVQDQHTAWDENLAKIVCAIRTSKSEATHETPYFVNFGRSMVLSGKDFARRDVFKDEEVVPEQSKDEALKDLFRFVKRRLAAASQKNKKAYNLRRRPEQFHVGQEVYRTNHVLSNAPDRFSRKLAPKFVGPFTIKRKVSPWTYVLADTNGVERGTWNAKDLKSKPPDLQ